MIILAFSGMVVEVGEGLGLVAHLYLGAVVVSGQLLFPCWFLTTVWTALPLPTILVFIIPVTFVTGAVYAVYVHWHMFVEEVPQCGSQWLKVVCK